MWPPFVPVLGASAAFYAVFSLFLVAFAVLTIITLTWAVRRDRAGRRDWLERRRQERPSATPGLPTPSQASDRDGSRRRRRPPTGGVAGKRDRGR